MNKRSLQRCAYYIYGVYIQEPIDLNKYNNHNIIMYTEWKKLIYILYGKY